MEVERAAIFESEFELVVVDSGVSGEISVGDGWDGADPGVRAEHRGGNVRVGDARKGGAEGLEGRGGGGGNVDDLWGGKGVG